MRLVCVTFCIDLEKIKQLALSKSKLLPSLMRCRRQTRWLSSSSWWRKDNRSLRRLPRMRRRASSCWESFTATRNILRACWKIKVPCHSGLAVFVSTVILGPPIERVPSSPSSRSDTGDDEKWGAIEGCHPGLPPKPQHVHRALGPGETHWLVRERDQEQGGEKWQAFSDHHLWTEPVCAEELGGN